MAATVSFRLSLPRKGKPADPDRSYPIMVSYFHRGLKLKDLATGERCCPAGWNGSRLSRSAARAAQVNKVLSDLENRLLNVPYDYPGINPDNEEKIVRAIVKRESVPATATEKKTIVQLWSEYLESIHDTVEYHTFRNYSNSFHTTPDKNGKFRVSYNFREWLKTRKLESITPDKFNLTHYNQYRGYLKKNVAPNTAAHRIKHFKQFCDYCAALKIEFGFDTSTITYKETAGLKISLSEEELRAYIDADLPAHLQKARDLAVLQCATGLRISDRKRIDKNIRGDKIAIEAQKTRSRMEIPIVPKVREILERYDYDLPKISEQKYREGIKAIHKLLFPEKTIQVRDGSGYRDVYKHEEISSHDMVRTFITLSAERGMSVTSIAKITGKSVSTLLKNYLVESQKTANKEMQKAWGSEPLMKVS